MTAYLAAETLTAWDLTQVRSVSRVEGGELKDVFRLEHGDQSLALRLYPPEATPEMVASELALAGEFPTRLAEVPGPIATSVGTRFFVEETGRVAVLTAFIEGEHPDRAIATHRRAAAEMLARLHATASAIEDARPRASYPAWTAFDWRDNQWWIWPRVRQYLHEPDLGRMPGLNSIGLEKRLEQQLWSQPDELAAIARLDLPVIPIHNDFFEGNLIYRDGRIVGIVDWDEARLDWRAWDIANATWSFSRAVEDHRMDVPVAKAFLADYVAAGGEVTDDERRVLVPLMRARLLWETLYELGRGCQGANTDWGYLYGNLTALDDCSEEYL